MQKLAKFRSLLLWLLLPVPVILFFNNCGDNGVLKGSDSSTSINQDPPPKTATNQAPQVEIIQNMNLPLGTRFEDFIDATDAEGQTLTYSATGLPTGLSINSATGVISGMLREIGNFSVSISVSDGQSTTSRNATFIVGAPQVLNNYPVQRALIAPVVDGNLNEYLNAPQLVLTNATGHLVSYSLLYTNQGLYIAGQYWDVDLNVQSLVDNTALYNDDSIEIMLDTLNDGGTAAVVDDFKFFTSVAGLQRSVQAGAAVANNFTKMVQVYNAGVVNDGVADAGWAVELYIPWAGINATPPVAGRVMGFDIVFNDRLADGTNIKTVWKNTTVGGVNDPNGFGDLVFQ